MRNQSRAGFTLIELMVALALTMFLMIILTQCFVLSLETFAGMKGLGDMQQNLRTATTLLASDLSEDHLEGKRRLSDPNIFNSAFPIQAGYFAIKQGSASTVEGVDSNLLPSTRATNHILAFTVKRKGNRAENFFTTALRSNNALILNEFFFPFGPAGTNTRSTAYGMLSTPSSPMVGGSVPGYPPAVLPPNYTAPPAFTNNEPDVPTVTSTPPWTGAGTLAFYSSQWAEVYYYLVQTGSTEEPNNPNSTLGTPIYALYRAQFVMVPDSTWVNARNPAAGANPIPFSNANLRVFRGLSCNKDTINGTAIWFNSPTDAANNTARRTVNINAVTYIPITPSNFAQADARFVPGIPPYLGTGTGTSENGAANQNEGSTELVLPNVLSFQVQVIPGVDAWNGQTPYVVGNLVSFNGVKFVSTSGTPSTPNIGQVPSTSPASWATTAITGSDLVDLPNSGTLGLSYDTGLFSSTAVPYTNNFGLKAIRVTLRVWDNATRQTRQASITQDL